jgi:hypothetical protein
MFFLKKSKDENDVMLNFKTCKKYLSVVKFLSINAGFIFIEWYENK